jgi:hypothetical protein
MVITQGVNPEVTLTGYVDAAADQRQSTSEELVRPLRTT